MHDDTTTSSWKRFTDKASGLRGEPADDHFAEVASAPFCETRTAPSAFRDLLRCCAWRNSGPAWGISYLPGLERIKETIPLL
jgi:hypothetical protein